MHQVCRVVVLTPCSLTADLPVFAPCPLESHFFLAAGRTLGNSNPSEDSSGEVSQRLTVVFNILIPQWVLLVA